MVLEGKDGDVARAFDLVESIKGEPPIKLRKGELLGTIEQMKRQTTS
jgi:hypothetical protein